ncbi:MAG TPA: DEAD/DEAH box helicase, partial [Gammaproteobacteria bacterium]|nr:DEAD/DEAH box helicase [Gammaproteobacteria bacterium]
MTDTSGQAFRNFFERVTSHAPFAYQQRLGDQEWPDWVDVPTGLGKTAGVGVAWLHKRLRGDAATPRRLVYCLPMRVLVEQTRRSFGEWIEAAAPAFEAAGREPPEVHLLMGGDADAPWAAEPERDAVIIGTQDMLLSRALMRGYGMSRYQWSIHFALLHNDALWVYDEVQLMGPALATSAQLEGLRRDAALTPTRPTRSLWLSATLNSDWLATVDLREHLPAMRPLTLNREDAANPAVRDRREAGKPLRPAESRLSSDHTSLSGRRAYAAALAAEVQDAHARSDRGDTLVVLNTVERAQALHDALARENAAPLLVHARFRPHERRA